MSSSSFSSVYSFSNYSEGVEAIQITLHVIIWTIFIGLTGTAIYVYRGHHAHELWIGILYHKSLSGEYLDSIKKRKWLLLLINGNLLFALSHSLFYEPLILAMDIALNESLDAGDSLNAAIRVFQLRRIGDYIDYSLYFGLFCLVVIVWLQSALVWADKQQHNITATVRKAVYGTLASLMGIYMLALAPLTAFAIYELCRPSSAPSTASIRTPILYFWSLPLLGLSITSVLVLVIAIGIKIVSMIRTFNAKCSNTADNEKEAESHQNQIEGERNDSIESTKALDHQRYQQRAVSIKISIVMIFFSICAFFRIFGVVLLLTNLPPFVTIILYLKIPGLLFLSMISITFWPIYKKKKIK